MASPHVREIVKKAGGTKAVCEALGIKPQAISNWADIPPKHMLRLAALGVPLNEQRPDLLPSEGAEK